ncbi:TPA: hypothetical protein ACJIK4_004495 [Kluyvera cryocrescens]
MLRIGQVESSATTDGKYTDGNVAGGISATRLRASAFNAIQEELAHIVESTDVDLDVDDMTQVLTALKVMFAANTESIGALAALVGAANKLPYFTGPKAASLTDLTSVGRNIIGKATVADVLTYLGLGAAAKQGVAKSTEMQAGTATDLLPSVAAVMSLFSKRSFATNDFIRIPDVPGGLIIQWGEATTSPAGYVVNFPMMFPTSCFGVVLSDRAGSVVVGSKNRTQSSFELVSSIAGTTVSFFVAIGR